MARRARILLAAVVTVAAAYVALQAVVTLRALTIIERERDTWQRPSDILDALDLSPGQTVVDLGSGVGYFTLKIAPRVGRDGRVLAVDLRRESLAFLWMRTVLRGLSRVVDITRGDPTDPRLPARPVDAVLIANTYHELASPQPVLEALFLAMRPGAHLVVVDRAPRDEAESRATAATHHELTAAAAEDDITHQGFQVVSRTDRFIDRPEEPDVWWLMVFRKP